MKRIRLLIPIGLLCVVGLAASCTDSKARQDIAALQEAVTSLQALRSADSAYMAANAAWIAKAAVAICQLEKNNPAGLQSGDRICTGQPSGTVPPPAYPPK